VGYRVNSYQATQFRIWATQRLREYIVKGFTLDDERLKQGGTKNEYFDELLQRIREIRLSERNFYRKICDIYQTSIDYVPDAEMTQRFFQTVQNKMHWAVHGRTAAEVIDARADTSELEQEIDRHVYALYGLTPEEIQIVEESAKCNCPTPN
jgi:hypothetical protein